MQVPNLKQCYYVDDAGFRCQDSWVVNEFCSQDHYEKYSSKNYRNDKRIKRVMSKDELVQGIKKLAERAKNVRK